MVVQHTVIYIYYEIKGLYLFIKYAYACRHCNIACACRSALQLLLIILWFNIMHADWAWRNGGNGQCSQKFAT
jgi:hypothetical protein